MGDATAEAPSAAAAVVPSEEPRPARRHLHDVDVVRLTTVFGVLCVHGTSLMLPDSELTGAALAVLHVTREVFLFLSAFVLAYSTKVPVVARSFWRKRYPLVLVPYLVWSAIYVIADGNLDSPLNVVGRYGRDILSGAARFHLYFLILTLQLYLIFPWLRSWVARRRHHGRILGAVVVWQVAFTSAIYFRLQLPSPLSAWLSHPGTWLPSYVLYVVAGIIVACHFDEVRQRVAAVKGRIAVGATVVFVLGVVFYEVDVHALGESYVHAGGVFSPGVVIESCAAIAAQFAFGLWVASRAGPRLQRFLRTSSDVSFGVYLAHPLLYQGFLDILRAFGARGLTGLPAAAGLALLVLVVVPATYLTTGVAIWAVRRTPVSLALTGRRRRLVPAVL